MGEFSRQTLLNNVEKFCTISIILTAFDRKGHGKVLYASNGRENQTISRRFLYRVMVIFLSTAMRSESGGCVLNSPENTCPALSGATMNNDAVVGETFMGILAL